MEKEEIKQWVPNNRMVDSLMSAMVTQGLALRVTCQYMNTPRKHLSVTV